MKVTKIVCTLKKDKSTWVIGEKRFPGKKFTLVDPSPGQILNIKKSCDVEESQVEVDDVEIVCAPEEDSELYQFAVQCWDLAVALRNQISELKSKVEAKDLIEPEIQDVPESIEKEIVPEKKAASKKTKKTRTRKKKDK